MEIPADSLAGSSDNTIEFQPGFYESLPLRLGINYEVFWAVCSLTMYAAYVAATFSSGQSDSKYATFFFIAALNWFTPTAYVRSFRLVARFYEPISKVVDTNSEFDSETFHAWYRKEQDNLYHAKQNVACSLVGGTLFVISAYVMFGVPFQDNVSNLFFYANSTTIGLLGGPLYRFVIMSAIFVFKLSRIPMKIRIYNYPGDSVKLVGRFLLSGALYYATPAYGLCVIVAVLVKPIEITQVLWIGAGALIVLGYFLIPQWSLHTAMVRSRDSYLSSLSRSLDVSYERWLADPAPEALERLERLEEFRQKIGRMEVWPFEVRWLSGLATTLLTLLLPVMIQFYLLQQN